MFLHVNDRMPFKDTGRLCAVINIPQATPVVTRYLGFGYIAHLIIFFFFKKQKAPDPRKLHKSGMSLNLNIIYIYNGHFEQMG